MKNSLIVVLSAIFLNTVVASAQQQQRDPPPQTQQQEQIRRFRELVMKPVVYTVPGTDQVKVISDLKYNESDSQYRRMDLYLPPGPGKSERLPVVFFIHGGTSEQFTPKDWGIYTSWGRLVAASGMIGVTFTHRLGFPKTFVTEAANDVDDAINYVRTNAERFQVDKDRVCLIAFSAGGPMLSSAMREKPSFVRCLVAFYAFMDIQQSEFHKNSETPETVKKYSNITYMTEGVATQIAPLFIARAGRDDVPTMNDSIDRFIGEALSKNMAITVMNHPTGSHGFDNQNDDERSREIIQSAIAFMKLHLCVSK